MTLARFVTGLALALVLWAGQAHAAAIQFTGALAPTLATFQTQTGATNVVGGNFPNLGLVADGVLDGSGETYVGTLDLTYSPPSTQLYSGTLGLSFSEWSTLLAGPDLALSDREHLLATMPSPVYAMGFEFVEPSNGGPPPDNANCSTFPNCPQDSTFTVTLFNGVTQVHSFAFNAPDDTAYFVGIWTDFPFTRMDINETTGTLDNEYFNRFYAGTTPIPEPGSLLLLGTGAAILLRRRRK